MGWSPPQGPPVCETRGKTAPNRLRQVDAFVCAWAPGLFTPRGAMSQTWVVDLGFGRVPRTTLELAARLWNLDPTIPILGVERDPERVARAQQDASPRLTFRLGDFELPLQPGERVRMIRAMNVLRQYPEASARPALAQLVQQLEPGGLLVEGTCHPFGQVLVVGLYGKTSEGQMVHHGLLFATNFRQGFAPDIYPSVLPKHLIHRMVPGEEIYDFFQHWEQAAREASHAKSFGIRQHYVATARVLAQRVSGITLKERWLRRGWLFWSDAPF